MERMKLTEKEKEQILKSGAEAMSNIIERMSIEMGELEEENKNLNKHLGEKIDRIQVLIREKHEERGEKLELFKENKNLNIIIENTKIEQEADRKHIEELEEENKKLKSDLEECECSMHFENDEVGYRKREYKRLKKWIKDHCKGYGNLFPEDEMKRQRKKADKKRKKSELFKVFIF